MTLKSMFKGLVCSVVLAFPCLSNAGLLGTELGIQVLSQTTATSPVTAEGTLVTATVSEPAIEFPNLGATDFSGGLRVVNVDVNAGDDFLSIDFDNAGLGTFASAFFNGYEFTFDNGAFLSITDAVIDTMVTTLGLDDSDVSFSGNSLFVNVDRLPYKPSSFARINLTSTDVPDAQVPEPSTTFLFSIGLLGLLVRARSLAKG